MLYCQDERELNCDSCYEVSYEYCNSISVQAGLTPSETYYLNLIDKFNNRYTQDITVGLDGSFDIDATLLPESYFNPFGGKFEAYLSTTDQGTDYISMTFEAQNYNCLLISIDWTQERDCC